MMLFVVCKHCEKTVEDRRTLDICAFVKWRCPHCDAVNEPMAQTGAEETELEEGEISIEEQITMEVADIDPENMEGNIL